MGGEVYWDEYAIWVEPDPKTLRDEPFYRVGMVGDKWQGGNEGFAQLAGIDHLYKVRLYRPKAVDERCIKYLEQLVSLRALRIERCPWFGDAELARLKALPKLRKLALGDVPVTDAGLKELNPHLEVLTLESARSPTMGCMR